MNKTGETECRICGCTDSQACEGGCCWTNAEEDLCCKCAITQAQSDTIEKARNKIEALNEYEGDGPNHQIETMLLKSQVLSALDNLTNTKEE